MNFNTQKEKIIHYYKDIILESIKSKKIKKQEIIKYMKNISLNKKDYKRIYTEIITTINTHKYSLNVNQIENIISILSKRNNSIKFDFVNQETDPTIYYYINNDMYLINFDSLENKWYLSLIEKDSLKLIEEIYSDYYDKFIDYLKNKSHQEILMALKE